MSSYFSWKPSAAPPRQRIGQFAELIDRVHLGWDLDSYHAKSFNAEVSGRQIAEVSVTDVTVDPICGQRSRKEISKQENEYYGFISILEGQELLVQGDNQSLLKPGDCTVWHTSRPARFSSTERTRQVSVFVPCDVVERRFPTIGDYCCQHFDGQSGFGVLLRNYFRTIPLIYNEIDEQAALCLVDPILDMMTGALSGQVEQYSESRHRHQLLARVRQFICDNIDNADLGPSLIAHHCGFSQRYLHKIFSSTGQTVTGYIRNHRLQFAAAELRKPLGCELSITELAYRTGFSDSSYFSRAFRQAFGVSPSEYKKRLLNG